MAYCAMHEKPFSDKEDCPHCESNRITVFVCSKPKCADGEHIWDGPTVQVGRAYSVSCSKCGISAFEVDTFMGGF